MNKKYISFFFIILSLSTAIMHIIFSKQHQQLTHKLESEMETLHENISDRFNLLISTHRAIGLMASEMLETVKPDSPEYNKLTEHVLSHYHEILGLNILNEKGVIIKVAPERYNFQALGKVTQNYQALNESMLKLEPYWLSAPFSLYQGPDGFSFYVPFYVDGKFSGWVAPIISVDLFFKKFMRSKYLEDYQLVIHDGLTKRNYFATSPVPEGQTNLYQATINIYGRDITFISWPKNPVESNQMQFAVSFLIALFVSALSTLSFYFYNQRAKTKERFHYIHSILNLTIQDTNHTLRTIHYQLQQAILGGTTARMDRILKHISYVSSLVRQIEVLGKLTGSVDRKEFTKTPILPVLLELSELYNDHFVEKRLLFNYDPEELSKVEVMADKWLLTHSVFAHFLRQAINDAVPESDINFKHQVKDEMNCFSIIYTGKGFSEDFLKQKMSGKENYVAEKVIHLHHGTLIFANTQTGAEISIQLPILSG